MQVRFQKLHEDAVLPFYGTEGAAGLDVTATSKSYDEYGNVVYGTGIAMEIPIGYVCLIFPRSSNAKKDLILSNSVGVLDSDYRGELSFKFKPSGIAIPVYENDIPIQPVVQWPNSDLIEYEVGDRIGQLVIIPYPKIEPEWADELSSTDRGDAGWGSTGA